MLNAEKYKKEISECIYGYDSARFSISKDRAPQIKYCDATNCDDCMLSEQEGYCSLKRMKWLISEYKEPIKLSRLEYEILKHVQKEGFNFITRNNCGNSVIHEIKPIKHDGSIGWGTTSKSYMLYAFNGLFKFVTSEDEKPTSIKEVLDNCIVENIKEEQ